MAEVSAMGLPMRWKSPHCLAWRPLVYCFCTVQAEPLGDPSATDVDAHAARLPGAFFF